MERPIQEPVEDEQQRHCKYRHCRHSIVSQRGHRHREYCDDLCKQAEYRARKEDREYAAEVARQQAQEAQELAHIRATYGVEVGLDKSTYRFLWYIWKRSGATLTRQISDVIVSEVQRRQVYGDGNSYSIPAGATRELAVNTSNFASNCTSCVSGNYTLTAYYQKNSPSISLNSISGGMEMDTSL